MSNTIPYFREAEQAVLAGLIRDNTKLNEISKLLTCEDFHDPKNQIIFKAISEIAGKGETFDIVIILEKLKNDGKLDTAGGSDYLCQISGNHCAESNVIRHAEIVKQTSLERKTSFCAGQLQKNPKNLDNALTELKKIQLEKAAANSSKTSKLKVINIAELLQYDCKPREFILSPILSQQSLSMIHAYRGIGKTFVVLELAHAVASGGSFLGWSAPKPRGVLFADGEMPLHALKERMANIIFASEKEAIAPLVFATPDLQELGMPDLATSEGQEQLEEFITPETELIIIDNLSCLMRSGRENEQEFWSPVQEWALKLRAKGKSIIFVHHSGKAGTQRGTSRKEDVLDIVISLKRPINYDPQQGALFEVHFEKTRYLYGQDGASFEAQLTKDPTTGKQCWTTRPLVLSPYDEVVSLANEGLSQKQISEIIGIDKSGVSRYYNRAKAEGKIQQGGEI